ncbi:hypothetical protein ACFQ4Z_20680 [Oceanobacillus oncorhynchi subsp. oncorhynchi]|uniref:hypothetical protein n=1 Tax=Oceanobacillus TaxID=182709 RepID=UPI0030D98DE6
MVSIGVLLAAVVFMIFEEQFGIPLHIVSVMGAMVIYTSSAIIFIKGVSEGTINSCFYGNEVTF